MQTLNHRQICIINITKRTTDRIISVTPHHCHAQGNNDWHSLVKGRALNRIYERIPRGTILWSCQVRSETSLAYNATADTTRDLFFRELPLFILMKYVKVTQQQTLCSFLFSFIRFVKKGKFFTYFFFYEIPQKLLQRLGWRHNTCSSAYGLESFASSPKWMKHKCHQNVCAMFVRSASSTKTLFSSLAPPLKSCISINRRADVVVKLHPGGTVWVWPVSISDLVITAGVVRVHGTLFSSNSKARLSWFK